MCKWVVCQKGHSRLCLIWQVRKGMQVIVNKWNMGDESHQPLCVMALLWRLTRVFLRNLHCRSIRTWLSRSCSSGIWKPESQRTELPTKLILHSHSSQSVKEDEWQQGYIRGAAIKYSSNSLPYQVFYWLTDWSFCQFVAQTWLRSDLEP